MSHARRHGAGAAAAVALATVLAVAPTVSATAAAGASVTIWPKDMTFTGHGVSRTTDGRFTVVRLKVQPSGDPQARSAKARTFVARHQGEHVRICALVRNVKNSASAFTGGVSIYLAGTTSAGSSGSLRVTSHTYTSRCFTKQLWAHATRQSNYGHVYLDQYGGTGRVDLVRKITVTTTD